MNIKQILTAAVVSLLVSPVVVAAPSEDAKKGIIERCKTQMGEYGAAMVKACVDQDIQALSALHKYPEKHQPIIDRCIVQMGDYGAAMVKACADQDIEAEKALSQY
jgi:hypothetical protein